MPRARRCWWITGIAGLLLNAGCSQMLGIEELELREQDGGGGAAGGADSSANDVSVTDVTADLSASDSSEGGVDAPTDAPPPDTGCPLGTKLCAGECVPTDQTATGCNRASCEPCVFAHGSAICETNGECALAQCVLGFEDCDGKSDTGCEIALKTDVANCGACAKACGFPHGVPQCVGGACQMSSCEPGWADCNGNPADGCETHSDEDPSNCGACGLGCAFPHAGAVCVSGGCDLGACDADYLDCDAIASNGCEVFAPTSLEHCGGCSQSCMADGGAALTCKGGSCVPDTCPTGYGDCDDNAVNGCEEELAISVLHCGACGYACAFANATPTCVAGLCSISACSAPYGDCDGNESNGCETNTSSSVEHCGSCATPCVPRPNAVAACVGGACSNVCSSGWGDCDGDVANGCETDLLSSTANCGACKTSCSDVNGVASCNEGVCAIKCDKGFGDCDPLAPGCETSLLTSVQNCGTCGVICSDAGGMPSCSAGVCSTSCAPGTGDCNGSPADGCETNLASAPEHCGGCGLSCLVPNTQSSCVAGKCVVASCLNGWEDCDGKADTGCEALPSSDPYNCGACGRACSSKDVLSFSCAAGACTSTCSLGASNCAQPATGADDGCETASNHQHCGSCGNDCTAQAGGFSCGGAGRPANQCSCDSSSDCNPVSGSGTCTTSGGNNGLCKCGNTHCRRGEHCKLDTQTNKDVCSCNGAEACDPLETCCLSPAGCRNLASDPQSCGACGRTCPPGFKCSSGVCSCTDAASCNAGAPGTCQGNACVCDGKTCPAGKRCQPGGVCG
ncbi:MAG TPA: hypothetical protein PLI95_13380 [Polyangiaceae bacterium]|mgnify:CR=1 FL=1|nr:hypothetical protein [Polyangiaceae bacterium]